MKNVQPLLFFFETINQWNYHTYKDIFDMKCSKKYEDMFHEALYGISDPHSKYEMYITSELQSHGIGFMMEDRALGEPVLFGKMQGYGSTATMWPDWMNIPMNSTRLVFDDRHESTKPLEVYDIEEDDHFQLMMIRDLPEHNIISKGIEVYQYLQPIANTHKIGFYVDYNHMDMDFNEFIPSENAFKTIENLFGNAVELYYEAEEHGKPFDHYTIS